MAMEKAAKHAAQRIGEFIGEEKLLASLAFLYLALSLLDRSLPRKTLAYIDIKTISIIISLML
ncbi:MAG: hypothetical protein F7C34_02895, partial [Desulfurococcales archaeon]|nr:hypothetical protein [Desulfurococcales archaeon]